MPCNSWLLFLLKLKCNPNSWQNSTTFLLDVFHNIPLFRTRCRRILYDSGAHNSVRFLEFASGNVLYYFGKDAEGEIVPERYYSFPAEIKAMEDEFYANEYLCVGLANGEVYLL